MRTKRAGPSFFGGCPFVLDGDAKRKCGEERQRLAKTDGQKYCKRHANIVDGRPTRLAAKKSETLCPVCSIEGRRVAAQSGHKYAGMCKRHAKMKTIEAEQRRPLPTCFVVCSRPLRHLCQMRAFACSSCGKRVNQPTGRRAPAPSHLLTDVRHGRRHVRCAEPPCSKRARIDHDGERFCQSHARWRIELARLRVLRLTGSGRPPSRRSTLAAWVSKQKE